MNRGLETGFIFRIQLNCGFESRFIWIRFPCIEQMNCKLIAPNDSRIGIPLTKVNLKWPRNRANLLFSENSIANLNYVPESRYASRKIESWFNTLIKVNLKIELWFKNLIHMNVGNAWRCPRIGERSGYWKTRFAWIKISNRNSCVRSQ